MRKRHGLGTRCQSATSLAESKDVYRNGRVRPGRELLLTQIGVGVTVVATVLAVAEIGALLWDGWRQADAGQLCEQLAFLAIVLGLVYGNLDYQASRIGYFRRLLRHAPAPPEDLDEFLDQAPPLSVLIPSYREQPRAIEQSVLSAALQRYPDRRVILLIDDPPDPEDPTARDELAGARAVVQHVAEALEKEALFYRGVRDDYLERRATGHAPDEYVALGAAYLRVAGWFEDRAAAHVRRDHADDLFIDLVLAQQAEFYSSHARRLLARADRAEPAEWNILDREYRRLAVVFDVEVSSFERKRYANLSHEANKAMNLNSYLSLMGRSFDVERRVDGSLELVEAASERPALSVPDSKYVVTLDADSVLHPDYALRLARVMEADEGGRLAVIQTPYSAFPNPSRTIERAAGGTTDVQYVIDQGSSWHDGTFWVGANAMLRRAALEDIGIEDEERGFRIRRYIQDRTVIEDTESTVDLLDRGWRLHNYPERLSFSATPDDFGSLVIQRHRWANGGLIILPKLLRYLLRRGNASVGEAFSRIHYLVSIPVVTAAVLGLLFYPFEQNLWSLWFPLTAVPYFALYGRDLVQAGYPLSDLLRVYVLNLALLPVNAGGVARSLQQAWTGRKTPFRSTPKIAQRVSAPPGYVLLEYALFIGLLLVTAFDLAYGRWLHASLGLFSAACFAYALVVYVGLRESLEDLAQGFERSAPKPERPRIAHAE
jgi:cellulose synthase/poly-beta-1,6-N-acetylglucosamine synthase-like glycosyltransferase